MWKNIYHKNLYYNKNNYYLSQQQFQFIQNNYQKNFNTKDYFIYLFKTQKLNQLQLIQQYIYINVYSILLTAIQMNQQQTNASGIKLRLKNINLKFEDCKINLHECINDKKSTYYILIINQKQLQLGIKKKNALAHPQHQINQLIFYQQRSKNSKNYLLHLFTRREMIKTNKPILLIFYILNQSIYIKKYSFINIQLFLWCYSNIICKGQIFQWY
ncbi:hypothetical protein TTHERM_000411679 (macronuclear) [Tetrahymena thermophila SB210]|uniref:Uncharacterized protein n=1 Tax=Tetrahymena thermophila (strain SB210) TaxID=312017 RepID=W7XID5_TETTS|nr:hypothetical protein TTHERM_000411679 [Tetrahymena thermophila SB210]EWS73204.1 hypothetical protein TTHERM_000411679 [Tetrahymena thermophila SB210]|eukprot:XP_012654280.1 hypothetical protein TTHERM_000411679 [Tetrahymena thermophila SB210]